VKSVRGAKGGYSLGKPPAEICLKDLVEILEGPVTLVDCLVDPKRCERSTACVTREIWNEVSESICSIFRSITLEGHGAETEGERGHGCSDVRNMKGEKKIQSSNIKVQNSEPRIERGCFKGEGEDAEDHC